MSRQPVLQALLLLKNQGFVRDAGRRGLMVAPLDPRQVADLYQIRAALDATAAASAACAADAGASAGGHALIAAGRAAVASGDLARMIAADIDFHRFIYDLSGNPLIAETAALHWRHIRRVMGGVLRARRVAEHVWDEHAGILDAVIARDVALAERLARAHAERAARDLADELAMRDDSKRRVSA